MGSNGAKNMDQTGRSTSTQTKMVILRWNSQKVIMIKIITSIVNFYVRLFRYFPIGISGLYINNLARDHPEQTQLVKQIVDYIMKAFVSLLKENTWMDKETMDEAVNKTNLMKIHAGFPIELMNNTAIDKE